MWKAIKVAFACSCSLLCLLQSARAMDGKMPNIETYGRVSPLIIIAKPQNDIRYEIIDTHRFYTYDKYEVISVEKDIISDYDIPEGEIIEIGNLYTPIAFGENTAERHINQQKIDRAEAERRGYKYHQDALLVCLTLSEKGNLELIKSRRLVEADDKKAMRAAGLFEPVGIDGLKAEYTHAEWQEIANAGVDGGYYQLNFADARPEGWPETLEGAANTAIEIIEEGGQLPIIDIKPFHDSILRHIGLAAQPSDKEVSEWHINKTLLLNMGRLPPREAQPIILDAVMPQLNKKYPIGFKDKWSSTTIEKFKFKGVPLGECLDYLTKEVEEQSDYKIVITPELAERKVNISLRDLNAFYCLQFITQQVGCSVEVELPTGKEAVIYIRDARL